jgi:hypothetical protein
VGDASITKERAQRRAGGSWRFDKVHYVNLSGLGVCPRGEANTCPNTHSHHAARAARIEIATRPTVPVIEASPK